MYHNRSGAKRIPADGSSRGLKRKFRNPLVSKHEQTASVSVHDSFKRGYDSEEELLPEEELKVIELLEEARLKKQTSESPHSFDNSNEDWDESSELNMAASTSPMVTSTINTSSITMDKETKKVPPPTPEISKPKSIKRKLAPEKQVLKDKHDRTLKEAYDRYSFVGVSLTKSSMKLIAPKGYKNKSERLPKIEVVNVNKKALTLTEAAMVNDMALRLEYDIEALLKTDGQLDMLSFLSTLKANPPSYVYMRDDSIPSRIQYGHKSNHSTYNFPKPSTVHRKWKTEVSRRELSENDVGNDLTDKRKVAIFAAIINKLIRYFEKKMATEEMITPHGMNIK